MTEARLPDGSGFFIATIDPDAPHPTRDRATECNGTLQDGSRCGAKAVFFNDGNVDVACHHCGSMEKDPHVRQYHLGEWVRFAVKGEDPTEAA